MTTDTTYNGWTNWETWLTNLHFDNAFTEDAQRAYDEAIADITLTREENAALALADFIKEYIGEVLDDSEGPREGFLSDIITGFSSSVNFYEIARGYMFQVNKEEA